MDTPNDPDEPTANEHRTLDELRAAFGRDPLPGGIVERAEGLVAWFDVDDELVAVLEEHRDELVGTRGLAPTSTFATSDGDAVVEIEVVRADDGDHVVGQLLVGGADRASLVDATGSVVQAVDVDELGRFELVVDADVHGPHRLRLVARVGTTVSTDWFVL